MDRSRVARFAVLPLLVLMLSLLAAACSSKSKHPSPAVQPFSQVAPTATVPPSPSATPDPAPLSGFAIPKFNVTANVIMMGVDPATNTMQSPPNKDDVADYDFASHPGDGCQADNQCSNTVLSGHVDWFTGQTGVFWHLKDLQNGDQIQLKLQDGVTYSYKVVSNTVYSDQTAPVDQIIGPTPQESVTLITCDGVFNKALQEYNMRRVVVATRDA